MDIPITGCTGKVYAAAPARRFFFVAIMVAVYACVIPYCYVTSGEPRKAAIINAQKLADEKWAKEARSLEANTTDATLFFNDTTSLIDHDLVAQQLPEVPAAAATTTTTITTAAAAGEEEVDPFGSSSSADLLGGAPGTTSGSGGGGFFSGWFGPTKEQKRAQQEFEKWQKQFNARSEDGPVSLPPAYLPSAWACLALFSALTLHALFYLLCHWITAFQAGALFAPAAKVAEGCFVLIYPPENRGKPAMEEVKKSKTTAVLQVEFQRQMYIYTPCKNLPTNEAQKLYPNGVFTLSECPTSLKLSEYIQAKGIRSSGTTGFELSLEQMQERWGKNHLAVHQPSFIEMMQTQLLSPLAIFQVFCALLWLLDEYWSYTLWQLASVVVFEATTVFQRNKTQKMLGGMAPKPTPIYVFRNGAWAMMTSKDLLPRDIISVAFRRRGNAVAEAAGTAVGNGVAPAAAGGGGVAGAQNASNGSNNALVSATPSSFGIPLTAQNEVVPCDCVLLQGAAVVNEASLTGESVPQMKEALSYNQQDEAAASSVEKLDMQGANRVNVLFSGTSLITVDASSDVPSKNSIPPAPDKGAIAFVLRTGFSSSQGALMQMIEFSQQSVAGDMRETGFALLLLLIFALIAAGYVLWVGLEKKEKTTHELLLKCVIIITSVVPRQFPMQMAMAVNMALMALVKTGIFCTEPFRVPIAGKVTHCLFDKTGTLTTDQLVPIGIINATSSNNDGNGAAPKNLEAVNEAGPFAAIILAACHSLVAVDDTPDPAPQGADGEQQQQQQQPPQAPKLTLAGDPIELAAMKGVEWHWDAASSTAKPGAWQVQEQALDVVKSKLAEWNALPDNQRPPTFSATIESLTSQKKALETKIDKAKSKASGCLFSNVRIVTRHHFSSATKMMSVVACCAPQDGDEQQKEWYCLVKGAPEALECLFEERFLPPWYAVCHTELARKGLRVLALGYRKVTNPAVMTDKVASEQPRAWVESHLLFGGFIAFECKTRADSPIVVRSLLDSGHSVAMLTGDSLLTSLHVAKQVGICSKNKPTLTLTEGGKGKGGAGKKDHWVQRVEAREEGGTATEKIIELDTASKDFGIVELAQTNDLLTSEETFLSIVGRTGKDESNLWQQTALFNVFARMSPRGKASIIRSIQKTSSENFVLMCGDGGNDVGALKQADVGIALLAGHANANTTEDLESKVATPASASAMTTAANGKSAGGVLSAEDALNVHEQQLKQRSDMINAKRIEHMKDFQARYQRESQALMQEQMKELTAKGEYMAIWSLIKDTGVKMKNAIQNENMRFMALHGQIYDPKSDGADAAAGAGGLGSIESMMQGMNDNEAAGGMPVVRPGDASVAAPFTSRVPSVRAVVDLIRQGRCTLLSALMQQQIMMLESIIAAYTLSALSLHNARSSERQMMASNWLIVTAAISFSYAAPLDHMASIRPLRSLFHPAIILSIFGQALIHIACMTLAVKWATDAMGPDKLKEVTEFFRKAKAKEIDAASLCGEDDVMCQFQAYWTAPFLPNLLNTTVFLVETSQMISVFFANYKGRPWMKGMLDNHPLFLSVFACVGGVVVASWELVPQLNELIQLAPFPDDTYRYKVVLLVMATIAGTLLWDRLCTALFAPKIFGAMMQEAKKTTLMDLAPVLMTLLKVVAVVAILGTGNIVLAGAAFYFYRTFTQQQAKNQLAKANK